MKKLYVPRETSGDFFRTHCMKTNDRYPSRRAPVHTPLDMGGNISPIIFVTVCTKDRKSILAQNEVVCLLKDAWLQYDSWAVGRYVVMPDHVHLFCAPVSFEFSLKSWMSCWKRHVSAHWPFPAALPVWQKGYWDTQLRRSEGYESKWEYTRRNPERAGLVKCAEDWPFAGELNRLRWHDR